MKISNQLSVIRTVFRAGILSAVALVMPVSAFAAGIGIAPEFFDIYHEDPAQNSQVVMGVFNTGENPALYRVFPDDLDQLIIVDNEQFRLESGESREIEIRIKSFPPGKYQTTLSIVGEDINADLSIPKTGVKIPITISVAGGSYQGRAIMISIIGLILLALFLLLFSVWRFKKKSILARKWDGLQERFIARSAKEWLYHYFKYHGLIIFSAISVILALGLLIWSFAVNQNLNSASELLQQGILYEYTVEIQTSQESKAFKLRDRVLSPFTALQRVAETEQLSLSYDPPAEMGVFVTEIAGDTNGEAGRYWVYEINDQRVPVAADRITLNPGDKLVWKFVEPDNE